MQYIPTYFTPQEFKNCTPSCSIDNMDEGFLRWLDELRNKVNQPLILNSAYRSKEYDISKGRSGKSAHTEGKAVDIKCTDNQLRYKIIQSAIELGCTRIGIGNSFIHLDIDDSLPQNCIWHYYN